MSDADAVIRHPLDEVNFSESDLARFWSRVNKDGPKPDQAIPHYAGLGPCWEWLGQKIRKGYGVLWLGKTFHAAHRISWKLSSGLVIGGSQILHKCDNPACVNPDHLFQGTNEDNVRDKVEKGRQRSPSGEDHWMKKRPEGILRGDDHPARKHPEIWRTKTGFGVYPRPLHLTRGEGHAQAKLTEAQVLEIQKKRKETGRTMQSLADEYGVKKVTVTAIINRRIWKHLP